MKYSKDGPFVDPLVRCDSCAKIITNESISTIGMCEHCGNRRIRNLQNFTEEEIGYWKDWRGKGGMRIDPEFFTLFEAVESE